MKVLFIVLGVVAVIAVFVIITYNALVGLRNKVKNSYAHIETQLQRRFDLIPNLVETVKGYASHEKDLLEKITAKRTGFMNAGSNSEKLAIDNQLTSSLKTLFAVAENYPDLKANENFINLQEELSEIEEKVAYSRQFYNDAVTMYNNKIQMFPGNIVAGMFGFKEEELFESLEGAKEVPKVKF